MDHDVLQSIRTISVPIWSGPIPGSIPNAAWHQTVDSEDGWTKVRFVTEPSLNIHLAPADRANGTGLLVMPGGGYWGLSVLTEGEKVAAWLNGLGITAFILNYRLPDPSIMQDPSVGPAQDAQRAMRVVRTRAKEWAIEPDKVGVLGFSAGGHLAATLSTLYKDPFYHEAEPTDARPDFSILIYPVISMQSSITHEGSREALLGPDPVEALVRRFSLDERVHREVPPTFLVHSMDDDIVPAANSLRYAGALGKAGVPFELHVYQSGGHGYDLGRSTNTESHWPEACERWLGSRGFLS